MATERSIRITNGKRHLYEAKIIYESLKSRDEAIVQYANVDNEWRAENIKNIEGLLKALNQALDFASNIE